MYASGAVQDGRRVRVDENSPPVLDAMRVGVWFVSLYTSVLSYNQAGECTSRSSGATFGVVSSPARGAACRTARMTRPRVRRSASSPCQSSSSGPSSALPGAGSGSPSVGARPRPRTQRDTPARDTRTSHEPPSCVSVRRDRTIHGAAHCDTFTECGGNAERKQVARDVVQRLERQRPRLVRRERRGLGDIEARRGLDERVELCKCKSTTKEIIGRSRRGARGTGHATRTRSAARR